MHHLTNHPSTAFLAQLRLSLGAFALVCTVLLAGVQAQSPRVFVSAQSGVDSGVCNLAQPCRTFTFALTQVSAKGEIVALDSGDYDQVTINKAVTIQTAPGVYAGINVTGSSVAAVRVQAGASDAVTLRGLTLYAQGGQAGQVGVSFAAGAALHVENCAINGFSLEGIFSAVGELFVKDTTVRDSGYALLISSNTVSPKAFIENCRIENSIHGLHAGSNAKVTVRNTTATGHSGTGFLAAPGTGASVELNLENCVSTNNATGIIANINATVRVSNSIITGNNTGIGFNGNGALLSRGNNTVEGNNGNGNFSGTYSAK
jgi:hypothetical protein